MFWNGRIISTNSRSDLASLYCILFARYANHQALIEDECEVWAVNTSYHATFKTEYR